MYRIRGEIRAKLKQPLGKLVVGNPEETMCHLQTELISIRPKKIIAIGDFITLQLLKAGISADLYVVDNKIMRKKIQPIPMKKIKTVTVNNPPGTITPEAVETVKKGVNSDSVMRILVDGEEDLLTLPAIKFAPKGTLILYGQPKKGLVMVTVTDKIQEEVEQILNQSEILDEPL